MSIPKEQTTLTSTVDRLLERNDLDFLKEEYENKFGISVPFTDCKRHYIKYLIALIAAHSFKVIDNSLKLSPPLHVDMLWHSHILETSRYREFEKIVLEAYRQSGRETNLQHLEHSVVDNKVGREERIKKTKGFYEMLGFVFVCEEKNLTLSNNITDVNGDKTNLGEGHVMSGSKRGLSNDQDRLGLGWTSVSKKKQKWQNADYEIHFKSGTKDDFEETIYKAKGSTKFRTVAKKYCEEVKGKPMNHYRFIVDGTAKGFDESTVGEILQEGYVDDVYVLPEQLGC